MVGQSFVLRVRNNPRTMKEENLRKLEKLQEIEKSNSVQNLRNYSLPF